MTTVLLTGFEPFGGDARNPSGEAVRLVAAEWGGPETLVVAVLPVAVRRRRRELERLIAEHSPSVVIAGGPRRRPRGDRRRACRGQPHRRAHPRQRGRSARRRAERAGRGGRALLLASGEGDRQGHRRLRHPRRALPLRRDVRVQPRVLRRRGASRRLSRASARGSSMCRGRRVRRLPARRRFRSTTSCGRSGIAVRTTLDTSADAAVPGGALH